jgi:hypothetical protein
LNIGALLNGAPDQTREIPDEAAAWLFYTSGGREAYTASPE